VFSIKTKGHLGALILGFLDYCRLNGARLWEIETKCVQSSLLKLVLQKKLCDGLVLAGYLRTEAQELKFILSRSASSNEILFTKKRSRGEVPSGLSGSSKHESVPWRGWLSLPVVFYVKATSKP